jgi:hypothetical protein
VAGKTGTAQIPGKGGYTLDMIHSLIGFAPIDNPRFTVLVRIDNPKDVQWAESSAAPTFGELMKFLLEYGNVEPTEEYTQKDLDIFNQTHNLRELLKAKEETEKKAAAEKKKEEEKKEAEKNN